MDNDAILIVDGHLDLAYNGLIHRRDLTQPVSRLREREDSIRTGLSDHADSLPTQRAPNVGSNGIAMVSLPELRRGCIGIVLSTIMARVQVAQPATLSGSRTQTIAEALGRSHLAYYQALARRGEITLIKSIEDLDRSVDAWQEPAPDTPIGIILSMESADPIGTTDGVADWWAAGLRSVSLTHFGANSYGHGTGSVGGLYASAYPLLDALRETKVAIDLSHASDSVFRQILDYWDGPVHASHCNCRAIVPGQRQLSDEMIRAIIDRDGIIGVVFYENMLNPGRNFDAAPTNAELATRPMRAVVEHIDHICQLAGNCRHVAIGSDLDGGYGRELAPTDMDTITDLQRFLTILGESGYSEADVAAVAHQNILRFFRNIWSL